MPNREVVRSLSRPKKGLPTIATNDPVAAISDRLFGARSVPTSELTFNASVTSSGAIRTSVVAKYAAAYTAMNVQPTERVAARSDPSPSRHHPSATS